MCEFVTEEPIAVLGARVIGTGRKVNVLTVRDGASVVRSGDRIRGDVRMQANVADVAEPDLFGSIDRLRRGCCAATFAEEIGLVYGGCGWRAPTVRFLDFSRLTGVRSWLEMRGKGSLSRRRRALLDAFRACARGRHTVVAIMAHGLVIRWMTNACSLRICA